MYINVHCHCFHLKCTDIVKAVVDIVVIVVVIVAVEEARLTLAPCAFNIEITVPTSSAHH